MTISRCVAIATVALTVAACSSSGGDEGETKGASPTTSTGQSSTAASAALTGRLMFSRFDENTHTFKSAHWIRPDGTDEHTIPLPGPEGGGQWSNAGDDIAVMTQLADKRLSTAIIRPDGTVLRTFTPPGTLNLVCTVWSPDDSRLACEGWDEKDDAKSGIYSVRASDGKDVQRLTSTPKGKNDQPGDYAPDNSVLIFKRVVEEQNAPLMVVPVGGGTARALTTTPYEDAGRYSPNGSEIITSVAGVIVVLGSDGKELRRITAEGRYLFGPDWSPDGTHIAYSSAFGAPLAEIVVDLPDGSDRHTITSTPDQNEITISWGRDAG